MAKLKTHLQTLAGLPANISDLYVKGDDGTYRLDIDTEGGWSLEKDAGGLRNAISKERAARAKMNAKLKEYGFAMDSDDNDLRPFGEEPIDAAAARAALRAIKDGSVKSTAELDERLKEYQRKFSNDIEAHATQVKKAHELLRQHFFQNEAKRLIKELGGNEQTELFLMPLLERQVQVEIQEDKPPRMTVRGPDGRELISQVAGSAEPMGLAEFIRAKRADKSFAAIWPAKAVGGSGGDTMVGGSVQGGSQSEPKQLAGAGEWARATLDKAFANQHGRA